MQLPSLARPAQQDSTEERTEAEVRFGEASYAYFLLIDSRSSNEQLDRAARAMDHWSAKLRAL